MCHISPSHPWSRRAVCATFPHSHGSRRAVCATFPHPMGVGRLYVPHSPSSHGSWEGCMRSYPPWEQGLYAQSSHLRREALCAELSPLYTPWEAYRAIHRGTHPGRHTGIYTTITHPGRHTGHIHHYYTPWEAYPEYIPPLHTLGGIPGVYTTCYTPWEAYPGYTYPVTHPGRHTRAIPHCYTPWEAYPGIPLYILTQGGIYPGLIPLLLSRFTVGQILP